MKTTLAKALFVVLATPAVLRAARRAATTLTTMPLDQAATALAAAPRWSWRVLDHPRWLAGTVDVWLRFLPPRGYGPCLRRSLTLLDLWGRCGLAPRLHLGMARVGGDRDFHAWVEADGISTGREGRWMEIWTSHSG